MPISDFTFGLMDVAANTGKLLNIDLMEALFSCLRVSWPRNSMIECGKKLRMKPNQIALAPLSKRKFFQKAL